VPRRRLRSRPSDSLMTPYAHRRFKGPFGSPLIVPILTLESSASRSRPHRIGRFRRRAILRRFVPHPRKMAKYAAARARKSLAHASEPVGPSRPATRHPPPGLRFPQTRRSARFAPPWRGPFQAPRTRPAVAVLEVPLRGIGTGGPQGPCQSPPSVRPQNSGPTAGGACFVPLRGITPLASLARQLFRRARRITGACTATRPSVCLLTPQAQRSASSVTCASMRNF